MATGRTRTRTSSSGTRGEYRYRSPLTGKESITPFDAPINKSVCTDVVGNRRGDNPLSIDHSRYLYQPINGQTGAPSSGIHTYKNYRPQGMAIPGHLPLPSSNGAMEVTKAYARSNPSRPAVDVALMAAEMKDLPALFEYAGRHMIKRGASEYLKFQFGWRPLVNDVMTLLDFQTQFDKRVKMLQKAKSQGMLTRNITLQSDQVERQDNTNVYLASYGTPVTGSYKTTTTRKSWAVTKWYPDGNFPATDEEMLRRAKSAVYSLRPDALTAWNLVPWSWMLDWFTSAGDFLESSRNTVGLRPGPACYMQHTISARVGSVATSPKELSGGESICTYETKFRRVFPGPQITADIPFLSGYQTSILGALAITRVPGHLLGAPNRLLKRY